MESARWLLLLTRLPGDAAQRERVGVWRKLKRSGALVLRDSVYLFPAKDEALEVARVTSIDGYPDAELVRRFDELRDVDYAELEPALKDALREGQKGGEEAK